MHSTVNVQIVPVTHALLEQIIDLGALLHAEEKTYEPLLTFSREDSLKHYANEITNTNALLIAASLSDGTIIGYQYSYTEKIDYLEAKNNQCTLEALYVLPEYRGMGIGKQLTDYAENWAITTQNVDRIVAHIYSENTASVQLHERDGFRAYNTEYIKHV